MNKKLLITTGVVDDLYSLAQNCYLFDNKRCLDIATNTHAKLKKQTYGNSTKLQKNISKRTYSYLVAGTSILKLFKIVPILITPDMPEEVLVYKVMLIKEEIKKELIVKSAPKRFNKIPLFSDMINPELFKKQMTEEKKAIKKLRIPSDEYKLLTFINRVGIYKDPFNKWLENESQGWKAQGETVTIGKILQRKQYYVPFLKLNQSLPDRIKKALQEPIILNYSQLSTLLKALSKDQLLVDPDTIKRQCSRFLQILIGKESIRAAQLLLKKRKK